MLSFIKFIVFSAFPFDKFNQNAIELIPFGNFMISFDSIYRNENYPFTRGEVISFVVFYNQQFNKRWPWNRNSKKMDKTKFIFARCFFTLVDNNKNLWKKRTNLHFCHYQTVRAVGVSFSFHYFNFM